MLGRGPAESKGPPPPPPLMDPCLTQLPSGRPCCAARSHLVALCWWAAACAAAPLKLQVHLREGQMNE